MRRTERETGERKGKERRAEPGCGPGKREALQASEAHRLSATDEQPSQTERGKEHCVKRERERRVREREREREGTEWEYA